MGDLSRFSAAYSFIPFFFTKKVISKGDPSFSSTLCREVVLQSAAQDAGQASRLEARKHLLQEPQADPVAGLPSEGLAHQPALPPPSPPCGQHPRSLAQKSPASQRQTRALK